VCCQLLHYIYWYDIDILLVLYDIGGDIWYCTSEIQKKMEFNYSPIEQQSLAMACGHNFTIFYQKRNFTFMRSSFAKLSELEEFHDIIVQTRT
jgi:hypothetical protein